MQRKPVRPPDRRTTGCRGHRPNYAGADRGRNASMKITKIHTDILRIPEDDPLADMPEEAGRLRPIVILRIQTDQGIEGIGLTFYAGALTGTLRSAVDELGALIVGEDPLRIEAILRKLGAAAGDACGSGIYTL